MPPHTDLETALEFVTRRVEEEAQRSGQPLTEEEHYLLHHLPTGPGVLASHSWGYYPATGTMDIAVRDFDYERLCALAKAAYEEDVRLDPGSPYRWEFAAAVAKLNRHPVAWLLAWGGVKVRKAWWDRWLLVGAAVLLTAVALVLVFLAAKEPTSPTFWLLEGAGFIALLLALPLVSRRMEARQLKQLIEKCRRSSRFGSAT